MKSKNQSYDSMLEATITEIDSPVIQCHENVVSEVLFNSYMDEFREQIYHLKAEIQTLRGIVNILAQGEKE